MIENRPVAVKTYMLALYVITNRTGTITCMLEVLRKEAQVTLQSRNGKSITALLSVSNRN